MIKLMQMSEIHGLVISLRMEGRRAESVRTETVMFVHFSPGVTTKTPLATECYSPSINVPSDSSGTSLGLGQKRSCYNTVQGYLSILPATLGSREFI